MLAGVAIGVGYDYGTLLVSISRNPSVRDNLIRWCFIGFSLIVIGIDVCRHAMYFCVFLFKIIYLLVVMIGLEVDCSKWLRLFILAFLIFMHFNFVF